MSYSDLYETYKRCFSSNFSGKKIQDNVNALWKEFRNDVENFPKNVEEKVKELKKSTTAKKADLLSFFTKVPAKSQSKQAEQALTSTDQDHQQPVREPGEESENAVNQESQPLPSTSAGKTPKRKVSASSGDSSDEDDVVPPTPAQDKLRKEITVLDPSSMLPSFLGTLDWRIHQFLPGFSGNQ